METDRVTGSGVTALALALGLGAWSAAWAGGMDNGGKLLLTGGVTNVEGAGGGGIATWATVTGYETVDGAGANLHITQLELPDFTFRTWGASAGYRDRVELSYARQEFDTGATGARLGLGRGFTFRQDVFGAKLRILGDAVYDQDRWRPQVSVGVQVKHNDQPGVVRAVGARDHDGVDYYVAATKVILDKSLVLDGTLRATRANQSGLLGFGGGRDGGYSLQAEGSVGYLVSRRLLVGAEYRTKPDNLAGLKEDDWWDLFAAYAVNKNLSVTAAYADLGTIATFRGQRGLYVSLQAGF